METKSISFWQDIMFESNIINHNININRTTDSITPLTHFILKEDIGMINLLLDSGCDVREGKDMAFCASVMTQNLKLTEKLLQMGANVNAVPNKLLIDMLAMGYPHLMELKYSFDYDMLCIYTDTIEIVHSLQGMLCYVSCINGSSDDYQMLKLLVDHGIDTNCYNESTVLDIFFRNKKLSVDVFKEIFFRQVANGKITSQHIVHFFYFAMENQYTGGDILNVLKEHLHRDTDAIDYLIPQVLNQILNGKHLPRIVLIYCMEHFCCHKYLEQFDKVCEKLTKHYHKLNYQLIDLTGKIGIDIKKYACNFYIQSIYHEDPALLDGLFKYVDKDLVLDSLKNNIRIRLKS